jgi:hypothetical protein
MSENGVVAISDGPSLFKIFEGVFDDRSGGIGRPAGPFLGKLLAYQKTMVF